MIVKPKVREFICTTAHPDGCKANVLRQIQYVKDQNITAGPKKVLVIGASTGYGLASRITAAFGCGADTIGVFFEKPSNGRMTATPGWYNTVAFEEAAAKEGLYAKSFNGDAFSLEMKEQVIDAIRSDLGKVDCVVYSLAAPRRKTPDGTMYSSTLKTTGDTFTNKSINLRDNSISLKTIEPANEEELTGTIKVMGGEDWRDWIDALKAADVLAENCVTVAYSYLGPELTYPIYFEGTIGYAKQHLHKTAKEICEAYSDVKAYISVNKALVTQASSAIPIVPLYFSILYKVMKEQGTHEGCIEQIARLFKDKLFVADPVIDEKGLIRMDDWELDPKVQTEVTKYWEAVSTENVVEMTDIKGYWDDFYQMFGFEMDGIDYEEDVEIIRPIPSIH